MADLIAKGECLYSVLGLAKGATDGELKTGYRKLAMRYHPDKGAGNEEAFKKVGFAYSVLKDPSKREVYDKTGSFGEGVVDESNLTDLMKAMFREVTEDNAADFFKDYKGSEEETRDLKEAYAKTKGSFLKMLDEVYYADDGTCAEEDRLCAKVQSLIDEGELTATPLWRKTKVTEKVKQSAAYAKRWEKRRKEYADMQATKAKLAQKTSTKKKNRSKEDDLIVAMREVMKKESGDIFAKLAAKYGADEDDSDGSIPDIDDAAFEAAKQKMAKKVPKRSPKRPLDAPPSPAAKKRVKRVVKKRVKAVAN